MASFDEYNLSVERGFNQDSPAHSGIHRVTRRLHHNEQTAPVGRSRVRMCRQRDDQGSRVRAAPVFADGPISVDQGERGPGVSGRGVGVAAHLQARKRPGLRKDSGPLCFQHFFQSFNSRRGRQPQRTAISGSHPRGSGRRERSLTTQRGTAPVLAGLHVSHIADVAQLVARNLAKVEATGSTPVVRSISGVPVHKHWAGSVCMCAGAAAPACSELPGLLGDSRAGTAEMELSCPRSSAGSSSRLVSGRSRVRIVAEGTR